MSGLVVREEVTQYLDAALAVPWYDLSYSQDLDQIAPTGRELFILIQFVGGADEIQTTGPPVCWREIGVFFIHVVSPVGGDTDQALALAESVRLALRNKRLGRTVVESVEPPTNAAGAAIQFKGAWQGFTMRANYYAETES